MNEQSKLKKMDLSTSGSDIDNLTFCVKRFHYLFPRNHISAVYEYDRKHYLFCDLPKKDYPGELIIGFRLLLVDKDGLSFVDQNPIINPECNKVMEKEVLYKEDRKKRNL